MSSRILVFAFAVAAVLLTANSASAQINGYYQGSSDNPVGPTVSPYLNLLNQGNFGGTNYQSLVRPLIDQGSAINRQGNSINRMQGQINSGIPGGGSRGTGHASFFMNYSHFYPGAARR